MNLIPISRPLIPTPSAPTTGIAVALYPSDASYNFELQRATSSGGAGATTIASDIPGTQPIFIDALGLDNTARWYRIRHMGFGDTPAAWTDWVGNVIPMVLPGNVTRPAATLPSFSESRSVSGNTATVTVGITDPQSRVSLVEFQTKTGTAAASGWVPDSSVPYSTTVIITAPESTIEYRITAYDANGVSQLVSQKAVVFIPGQNILGIKAAVVAGTISTTAFQVDITVADPNPVSATMTVSHAQQGCTVALTGGGSDPFTTTGGTFRYTVTRSATVDAGSGGVTFNVTATGRNDGNVFVPADATDQDAAPSLTLTPKPNGDVIAVATGNNNTASWRWAASTSSMPSDGTVTASGTIVNGRVPTVTIITGASIGNHIYAKFAPYTAAGAGGSVGQIVSAESDFQNQVAAKTIRLAHTFFASTNATDASHGISSVTPTAKIAIAIKGALIIPIGSTMTAWRVRASRVAGTGSIVATLYKVDTVGGSSSLGSLTHTTTGLQTMAATGLSETISGEFYIVYILIDTSTCTNANDNEVLYIEADYSSPSYVVSV